MSDFVAVAGSCRRVILRPIALDSTQVVAGPIRMHDAKVDPETRHPDLCPNFPAATLEGPRNGLLEDTLDRADRPLVVRRQRDGPSFSVVEECLARVWAPERGWTAWVLELTYDVGASKPLKLTTDVVVTPDVLPFADKPLHLPTSVTGICRADEPAAARDALVGASKEELGIGNLTTEILGDRLYVNWTPSDIRTSAIAVGKFLEAEGCGNGYFQLESGEGMTLPPGR